MMEEVAVSEVGTDVGDGPAERTGAMNDLFVALEGPIGVGKTTLMHRLAQTHGLRTEREIVVENPFLADFYEDIPRWAFQTEMFFLTSRYTQLRDLGERPRGVIADFHIVKNLIFARRTLGAEEHRRLDRVFGVLTEGLPAPDLTVILDAELPVLRGRIMRRGRDFEDAITDDYLLTLQADYREHAAHLQAAGEPVLLIDTSSLDIVAREDDYATIRSLIETAARKALTS